MNQMKNQAAWEQNAPYTAMLRQYQTIADKLVSRQNAVRDQIRRMQDNKQGTLASAREQKALEEYLLLLRTEYYELSDIMRRLSGYAAREVQ